jgi:hypothetical protein
MGPQDGVCWVRTAVGLGAVGDVRFHDQRGAARLVDLGGEGFQTVLAAGHQRDGGAVLGELEGGWRRRYRCSPGSPDGFR